jgi:hypothetical protein
MKASLELIDIRKVYFKTLGVGPISFAVDEGEFVSLLGHSRRCRLFYRWLNWLVATHTRLLRGSTNWWPGAEFVCARILDRVHQRDPGEITPWVM